ncbi:MAG: error-prone DNA polymerase [Polyangiaceae bacterium]
MNYVELTTSSNFSFLQGASAPDRLVARAAELGYSTVAITDRDGLYGAVRAFDEAKTRGIKLIVGAELTIGVKAPFSSLTVLCENHAGYTNLCRILTKSHAPWNKSKAKESEPGRPRNVYAGIAIEDVCAHSEGLFALVHLDHDAELVLPLVKEAFGDRASIALTRHLVGDDRERAKRALEAEKKYGIPIVAVNRVRYADADDKPLLDVVHCIREGLTIDRAGRSLQPNAEARLKSSSDMKELFSSLPSAITRTRQIADACTFRLDELKYRFPCELESPAFEGETANQALRRLTFVGANERYSGAVPEKVVAQIEKELSVIAEIEVAPYFLSTQSIVDMARKKDILCQGRGSAANSAVCYCLGVTAIDPMRSNLLFERFLSVERREPPDIDVDFEHERREEVIQEIYRTYGRDRAAMVSEIICYRGKSALRDVGKVFGLSLEQVERLSGTVSWWDGPSIVDEPRLRAAGFDPNDARVRMTLECARRIQGFPRHLSIHVGGFVLSAEPLDRVAPIEPATMKDRTVIPWDKDDLDSLGFFKVDVLGLGMLTAIRKAIDLASLRDDRLNGATAIDRLAQIPAEDPVVYDALCKADTVGVFQIESRAQMAMLPRLKPRVFYDLVVEVAIVRPGPIQGGMVHPYLRRKNGEESCRAPHPILEPILERTLGVPLFQEQVMQIAIVGAGYSGGEADQLRRDMAAWRRNGKLARHRDKLISGFERNGIEAEFGERLYAQVQGFGEYGFPESHAASFALLVYASSWLKVHHPAAFAAALVNSQPMGFYSASTILQDAARHGVEVRPISIHKSDWDCTLEEDSSAVPAIRVGLRQVKGLGEESGKQIEIARKTKPFVSLADVMTRANLQRAEVEALAEAGAFGSDRRGALWRARTVNDGGLFAQATTVESRPSLPPLTRAEQLTLDYERTGLSVKDHPMRLARAQLSPAIKNSRELMNGKHGERITVAGLAICRQRPGTASGVVFITMEDEYGFLNLILWSRVFEQFRYVATTSSMLVAYGKVERAAANAEVVYVVVDRIEPLMLRDTQVQSMSRDFH